MFTAFLKVSGFPVSPELHEIFYLVLNLPSQRIDSFLKRIYTDMARKYIM